MAVKQYGIQLILTPKDTGCTITLERATNSIFTVNHVTVYVQSAGVRANITISYTDVLSNSGATYYYRCIETETGFAPSAYSASVNSVPYDLGGPAP